MFPTEWDLSNHWPYRQRYKELIKFPRFRFSNGDISVYLQSCMNVRTSGPPWKTQFDQLEEAHERFMSKYKLTLQGTEERYPF